MKRSRLNDMRNYCWYMIVPVFFFICSCKESEIYPDIPSITFKSYYRVLDYTDQNSPPDTLIGIIFSYKDGDGDLGFNDGDTFPPYDPQTVKDEPTNPHYYNVIIDYFEIIDGIPVPSIKPSTTDTFRIGQRIPWLTPEGRHKAIRGDIERQFLPPLYSVADSVMLKIKIFDRALHESNTIESPVIVLR